LTLALRHAGQVPDWLPRISKLGRRLSRRSWPGPLTLVFAEGCEGGLAARLPDAVRQRVSPNGSLGLRVPAHAAILETMGRLPGPLVLTSANKSGEPEATSGRQVVDMLGDRLDLVIDDGPTRYAQPSTVVKVTGERWEILREGVVPAAMLERLSACVILFICTGNTCRSPMAEGLCKSLLAQTLGCAVGELPRRGFVVISAGVSAMMGCAATPEAIASAQAFDVSLEAHVSQPLTRPLLTQADYVFAMTRSHLRAVATRFPGDVDEAGDAAGETLLDVLDPGGDDIPDPIGTDQETYRRCAQQIVQSLQKRLEQIVQC
jgi:tRNA threonylcarbamoyl adenosine modification protein (Sua5/YciO/YrdC/YwlC family)